MNEWWTKETDSILVKLTKNVKCKAQQLEILFVDLVAISIRIWVWKAPFQSVNAFLKTPIVLAVFWDRFDASPWSEEASALKS